MSKRTPHPIHHHKSLTLVCTIFLFLFVITGMYLILSYTPNQNFQNSIYVSEITDGDTFKLSNGEVVRLICVDTPEIGRKGYDNAKYFLGSLILDKEVRLEDPEISNKSDRYGRSLRWVYVNISDGEILVNREIVRLGFGDILEFNKGECEGVIS